MKKFCIAPGSQIPPWPGSAAAFESIAAAARTRSDSADRSRVPYFVDTYANYHDPKLGEKPPRGPVACRRLSCTRQKHAIRWSVSLAVSDRIVDNREKLTWSAKGNQEIIGADGCRNGLRFLSGHSRSLYFAEGAFHFQHAAELLAINLCEHLARKRL